MLLHLPTPLSWKCKNNNEKKKSLNCITFSAWNSAYNLWMSYHNSPGTFTNTTSKSTVNKKSKKSANPCPKWTLSSKSIKSISPMTRKVKRIMTPMTASAITPFHNTVSASRSLLSTTPKTANKINSKNSSKKMPYQPLKILPIQHLPGSMSTSLKFSLLSTVGPKPLNKPITKSSTICLHIKLFKKRKKTTSKQKNSIVSM